MRNSKMYDNRGTVVVRDKLESSSNELLRTDMGTYMSQEFTTEVETCNHEPFN